MTGEAGTEGSERWSDGGFETVAPALTLIHSVSGASATFFASLKFSFSCWFCAVSFATCAFNAARVAAVSSSLLDTGSEAEATGCGTATGIFFAAGLEATGTTGMA